MRTGRRTAAVFLLAVAGLIAAILSEPWPGRITILLITTLVAAEYLRVRARRHRLPQPPPDYFHGSAFVPAVERMQENVAGVLLPSKEADYSFLFSATVLWTATRPGMYETTVNLAALAVDVILRRAREITQECDPRHASLIQHELASALAEMRDDPTGRLRVMASSVGLNLPSDDQRRLEKLATVRKEEAVWEHERRHEQNKRTYLSEDALKDPGSAVVWWLARNNDQVEKAVQDLGLLARLSCAARNQDVPETFHRLASDLGNLNGSGPLGTGLHESPAGAKSAADHFESFLDAMDMGDDDPERILFARRVADFAAKHGKADAAEELTDRFDSTSRREDTLEFDPEN